MGLFNLFGTKKASGSALTVNLPVPEQVVNGQSAIENSASVNHLSDRNAMMVSFATGWPIDIIYGYMHKNYEQKGFNDALINADLTFRDLNIGLIRDKILMVFREVNLKYDIMMNDLTHRISTCNAAGLITTVADLQNNVAVIEAHKKELATLESDFRSDEDIASIPIRSYDSGFRRGIASIAVGIAPDKVSASVTSENTNDKNKSVSA